VADDASDNAAASRAELPGADAEGAQPGNAPLGPGTRLRRDAGVAPSAEADGRAAQRACRMAVASQGSPRCGESPADSRRAPQGTARSVPARQVRRPGRRPASVV